MKKRLIVKTFLLGFILILFGLGAFYLLAVDSLAQTADQQLDQLMREMRILKIPNVTNPADVTLKDLNGNSVPLAEFSGKIVFLNFWTTWCPTCRIEMPSMEKLHQKLKHKEFAMVAVNLEESAARVKQFFKEYKLTFTALLDSTGDAGVRFGIRSIPTTFLLDKTGKLFGKVMGPREWDSQKSVALFEHLIDNYPAVSALESAERR